MAHYFAISVGGEPYDLIKHDEGRDGSQYAFFRHLPGVKISDHPTGKRHVDAAGGFREDLDVEPTTSEALEFVDALRYEPDYDGPIYGIPDPTYLDPERYREEREDRTILRWGEQLRDFAANCPPLVDVEDLRSFVDRTSASMPVAFDAVEGKLILVVETPEGILPMAMPSSCDNFLDRLANAPAMKERVGPIVRAMKTAKQAARYDAGAREQLQKLEEGVRRAVDPGLVSDLQDDLRRLGSNLR